MNLFEPNFKTNVKIELPQFELPKEPFIREITPEERRKLYRYFSGHSFSSNVDADNRIILGGGEEAAGKFYTTPEILESLV